MSSADLAPRDIERGAAEMNGSSPATGDRMTKLQLNHLVQLAHESAQTLYQLESEIKSSKRPVLGQNQAYFTVKEVAALIERAPCTVRQWIRNGKLPARRLQGTGPNGPFLVSRAAVNRLLDSGSVTAGFGLTTPREGNVGTEGSVLPLRAPGVTRTTNQGAA